MKIKNMWNHHLDIHSPKLTVRTCQEAEGPKRKVIGFNPSDSGAFAVSFRIPRIIYTLQGTNISFEKSILKMIFPFPRWGYVSFLDITHPGLNGFSYNFKLFWESKCPKYHPYYHNVALKKKRPRITGIKKQPSNWTHSFQLTGRGTTHGPVLLST